MKKKTALILIILDLLIGSFVCFYAGNLFASDISNLFQDLYLINSFPLLMFSFYFVLIFIFLIRFYRYPQFGKKIILLYTNIAVLLSLIGIITSIISGIIYESFVKPYPFFGYLFVMMISHTLILVAALITYFMVKEDMEEDKDIKKFKLKYILYSIVLPILTFMAMYRFGAVLWMPIYAQARTLYMTFVFYLWICLPMALLFHIVFYFLDIYKNMKQAVIYCGSILVVHLILGIIVIIIGSTNTQFISAISTALPLERLASSPIDTIIQMVLMLFLSAYYCLYSYISVKRELSK